MTTAPAELERRLTRQILRGEHAPGDRLPTVRELAATHGLSAATIQRVIERLQTRGLVTARQGSGLLVNDPWEVGGLSLLPAWLDATRDDVDHATGLLADFLELRRALAARLLARHRADVLARLPALADTALAVAGAAPTDLDAVRRADLAFARALIRGTPNRVALTLLNTLAAVLDELPEVARAMYADPAENVATMQALLTTLAEGGDAAALDAVIAAQDARTVQRFADGLRAAAKAPP
ncbi:MAG: GntR family transcriptional regulator [Alphaproteobacteria bacterium]|nr:GntR family transcriptional regulator [Alphaproteobacteria bacterium]